MYTNIITNCISTSGWRDGATVGCRTRARALLHNHLRHLVHTCTRTGWAKTELFLKSVLFKFVTRVRDEAAAFHISKC